MTPAEAADVLKSWRPHPHTTHHAHCGCRYEEAERLAVAAMAFCEVELEGGLHRLEGTALADAFERRSQAFLAWRALRNTKSP